MSGEAMGEGREGGVDAGTLRRRIGVVGGVVGVVIVAAVVTIRSRAPEREPSLVEPARVEAKQNEAKGIDAKQVETTRAGPETVSASVPGVMAAEHLAQAERYALQGRHDVAERVFAKAVEAPAITNEELQRVARGSKGAAGRAALTMLANREPGDPVPLRALALRLFEAGELDAAIATADEAIRRDPRSYESHQTKGRALMAKGRLAAAIRSFRTAVKDPDAPGSTWNQLGYAYLIAGSPSEAIEALDLALERGPVTHFMLNNLGLAYERVGRYDDAEIAYLGALELKSDYVKAAVNLQRIIDTREAIARQDFELMGRDPDGVEYVPGG